MTNGNGAAEFGITMRVDQDVVDYFKRKGHGYQTRMNAVLKAYVLHQKRK